MFFFRIFVREHFQNYVILKLEIKTEKMKSNANSPQINNSFNIEKINTFKTKDTLRTGKAE